MVGGNLDLTSLIFCRIISVTDIFATDTNLVLRSAFMTDTLQKPE